MKTQVSARPASSRAAAPQTTSGLAPHLTPQIEATEKVQLEGTSYEKKKRVRGGCQGTGEGSGDGRKAREKGYVAVSGWTQRRLYLSLRLQQAQGHCAHWVRTLNLEPRRLQHLVHFQDQHLQVTRRCVGIGRKGPALLPPPPARGASPSTGPLGDRLF